MVSSVNSYAASDTSTNSSSSSSSTGTTPPTEQMFMTLLVAQLKNQDPLNPVDGTQFVAQLAQFSQLEQTIGIRQDIEAYHAAATGTDSTTNNSTTNATS
jgi:flagellar basal-body rod modification protein FlgD